MAWFADLSPYAYVGAKSVAECELNVGWLAAGHEFPRGAPSAELVDALLRCALWPVRRYLGFHECEFCSEPAIELIADLDGRDVSLGNGEIRVQAADGRWYAAPTLVAHYVAAHEYAPPAEFVAAVRARAATVCVVAGARLRELARLDERARFEICARALDEFARRQGAPGLTEMAARIRALAPAAGVDRSRQRWKELIEATMAFANGHDELAALAGEVAHRTAGFFEGATRSTQQRDHDTLQCTARVVELAEQAGISIGLGAV